MSRNPPSNDELLDRARKLGFHGIVARWDQYRDQPWLPALIDHEVAERGKRSLERRIRAASLGRFKLMADFDWSWPTRIDRPLIEDVLKLDFIAEAANVVLLGPGGVGKTTIAQNIAYQALMAGHAALRVGASEMLNDLGRQDTSVALARRLKRYVAPTLLMIDEIGYLSHDQRAADLLFEVVSRRHQERSIIVTTNKPFGEWNEIFPNAGSVTALIDRLLHRVEIINIEGESYRVKESRDRAAGKARQRAAGRKKGPGPDKRGK